MPTKVNPFTLVRFTWLAWLRFLASAPLRNTLDSAVPRCIDRGGTAGIGPRQRPVGATDQNLA